MKQAKEISSCLDPPDDMTDNTSASSAKKIKTCTGTDISDDTDQASAKALENILLKVTGGIFNSNVTFSINTSMK